MREAKYNAAIETHRHCDTISMALITGMLAITGFSFSLYKSESLNCYSPYIFLASVPIVLILYQMYRVSSENARIARNVARALEKSDGEGISYVLYNMKHGEDAEKKRLKDLYGPQKPDLITRTSIYRLVNYLACILIVSLIAAFFITR